VTAAEIDNLRIRLDQEIAMLRNEIQQMSDGLAAERHVPSSHRGICRGDAREDFRCLD